jgi:hypothetical protein
VYLKLHSNKKPALKGVFVAAKEIIYVLSKISQKEHSVRIFMIFVYCKENSSVIKYEIKANEKIEIKNESAI